MTDFAQLAIFKLLAGAHSNAENGVCAMEAVAWLEGLPHSDKPACTCPIIGAYVRSLNDSLPDIERQRLVPYLPRLVGTVSPEHEWPRAQYFGARSFGAHWPIILRICNLEQHALEFEKVGAEWMKPAALDALDALDARADLGALAARAARTALGDRADLAALAAQAALGALADLAALGALADLAALDAQAARTALDARAKKELYQSHFETLDGALNIGAPSPGFSKPIEKRVAEYRELMRA